MPAFPFMEPSSTNSSNGTSTNSSNGTSTNFSDGTRVESHEMLDVGPAHPSPTMQPEQATGRTRVRFNSSAAEIPPPLERCSRSRSYTRSYTRISGAESSHGSSDQHTADAEELLNAHNAGRAGADADSDGFHAPAPAESDQDENYAVTGSSQGGIFYQLLQAYKAPVPALNDTPSEASTASPTRTRPGSWSGVATPSTPSRKKWYHDVEKANQSQETLATLIGASAKLANPNDKKETIRPHHKRTASGGVLAKVWKAKEDKDTRIKIHVANILKRQQYIIRMCRALMLFGAPTHRLEEYLAATAKVLEINSQFLYIPGCMIISFDDVLTQ